jgi:cellobiose phosphorylase
MWARSAFYQSGGAYGFRDQLQDSLAVLHIWPEAAKEQILLHASHQFLEGDVQHWWHEPTSKGTRTKFSDDLLWLPYVTSEYIKVTGDYSILDQQAPYLQDEELKEHEDEKYTIPSLSEKTGTIYEHCIKAVERSLKTGEHGIPLMGSGDWNDGMNTVGNKGKGESIWLGWFLCSVLKKLAPLCRHSNDDERTERYLKASEEIAKAIEENGWDGGWYRRAYFDDGKVLGSIENSECKIDSISQSWAVISGAGNAERAVQSMNYAEDYLVMRDEGLVKLLTPAFDDGELEPGYIKGYVPGVRENGGQYTHAAVWTIIAFAMLGNGETAYELFHLVNPINHTLTHMEYTKYKVEPYVTAADVYSSTSHIGRGGWTWYTGSSSWFYRAGMEYILGFRKEGDSILLDPCIPGSWSEYRMNYRYDSSQYEIIVKNPSGVVKGVKEVLLDGIKYEGNLIPLDGKAGNHKIEVIMG